MTEVETEFGAVYYEEGGEGEPMILVHGNYGSSRWWRPILGKVGDYRMIALDLPSFGRSSKPESEHTIPAYSTYLEYFIKEMDLNEFHLIGHSMGGAVAIRYALDHPEHLKKLILVAPASATGFDVSPFQKFIFSILNGRDFVLRSAMSKLIPEDHPMFDALLDDAFNMKKSAIKAHVAALENFNVSDELGNLEAPLYLIRGENDNLVKEEDMDGYKDYAQDYVVIKNSGHAPFVEKPGEFITILENILSS